MSSSHLIRAAELTAVTRTAVVAAKDLREVCGLLVQTGDVLTLVPTRNCSTEPGSFEIEHKDVDRVVLEASAAGRAVVGTFHSHVSSAAEPGDGDIAAAYSELMLIIDTCHQTARLWRIRSGCAQEESFILLG